MSKDLLVYAMNILLNFGIAYLLFLSGDELVVGSGSIFYLN